MGYEELELVVVGSYRWLWLYLYLFVVVSSYLIY